MAKEAKKNVKTVAKKEIKKTKKENYFKSVKKEMALVKWPEFKDIIKYTVATIVFCAVICGFFLLLNLLLSVIKGWF